MPYRAIFKGFIKFKYHNFERLDAIDQDDFQCLVQNCLNIGWLLHETQKQEYIPRNRVMLLIKMITFTSVDAGDIFCLK